MESILSEDIFENSIFEVKEPLPRPGFLDWGGQKTFFVPNEFNCIKIDNKAIFLLK
jgi:hypothetical protein